MGYPKIHLNINMLYLIIYLIMIRKNDENGGRDMRNPKLKYSGIVVTIIGMLVLAAMFFVYVSRYINNVHPSELPLGGYVIIGAIMLVGGFFVFIFVEE